MAVMVIEVPEELKGLLPAMVEYVAVIKKARDRAAGGRSHDYAAVEDEVAEGVASMEQAGHRVVLQALDLDRPAVIIGGSRHTKVGRCEGTYYTLAGPVVVERSLYRKDGERNGKVVDAVSLGAGVVADGWLPRTARAMAYGVQQGTSREAAASARQSGRLPYSRSSFERVAHAVGSVYAPVRADVEDMLIEEYDLPAGARSISASLDRVNVPIEEPLPRPVGRPKKGAPKKPVARNFRQAYCGTVTLHDEDGEAMHTIRYGRMPQGDPEALCASLAGDVLAFVRERPRLKVELLCDGAPEMWKLLGAAVNEEVVGTEVGQLVDFWHTIEKVGRAAKVIHGDQSPAVVQRWKMSLLNRSSAATDIVAELAASGKEDVKVGDEQPVHEAMTYLTNHKERMDYATARRLGLPIGSGNMDATCKSLFEVRFKRCGSRWKNETGEHIVQLRALALSDRWDRAIDLTLQPLRRTVRPA